MFAAKLSLLLQSQTVWYQWYQNYPPLIRLWWAPLLMLTLTYLGNNVSVDHGTEGGLCDKRVEASRLPQVSNLLWLKVVDPGIGRQTMERPEHLWIRLLHVFVPIRIPEGIRGIFIFLCCFTSWLKNFLSCWKSSNVTWPDDQIRMSVAALNLSVEILLHQYWLENLKSEIVLRICFSLEMTNTLHICIFLHSDLCLIFTYF